MKGKTGTSTGGIHLSPAKRRARARRRRAEEKRWAELSGPVIVKKLGDEQQQT